MSPTSRIGATLVELMIALTVLVLGVTASIGAMGQANMMERRTTATNRAMAEIQTQIEILQALDQEALNARFATSSVLYFPVAGLRTQAGQIETGQIERLTITGSSPCQCLRFRVRWNDDGGDMTIENYFFYKDRN